MSEKDMWGKFLEIIEGELTSILYETWFKETELHKIVDNKVKILVPMPFHKKQLGETYIDMIVDKFKEVSGNTYEFEFLLEEELEKEEPVVIKEVKQTSNNAEQAHLNPNYTFETYAVGAPNKFAVTAAVMVADHPGEIYNPFFLYASSGLGKTHLMQAIGNYIIQNSNKRVLYVSSEKFIQDFIGINKKNNNNIDNIDYFKNKYRNIDVLIIDDIQFLADAPKSQQEFFHTFNDLHQEGKQIIISSDRSPDDLKILEERLRTRFSMGLTVALDPPDFNLALQIIEKKSKIYNIPKEVDREVYEFMASNFTTGRAIDGAFNRLLAYTAMFNPPKITIEVATEALKEQTKSFSYMKNDISKIQNVVARYYNISVDDMKSKKRTKNIAFPRQIAMYLSRELTDKSLARIGLEFGGKDHTTIMHGIEKITKEMKKDSGLVEIINNIKEQLK